MMRAPRGTSACDSLMVGISIPRTRNRARICSSTASSRTSRRRNTVAIVFRVRSSEVAPKPPVVITTWARWAAARKTSAMREASSPTVVWYCTSIPIDARWAAIMAPFVSRPIPFRSSVPIVMISALMARPIVAQPEARRS